MSNKIYACMTVKHLSITVANTMLFLLYDKVHTDNDSVQIMVQRTINNIVLFLQDESVSIP